MIGKSLNAAVWIKSIEHHISLEQHSDILGYSIDSPLYSYSNDIHLLNISGWMLGRERRVLSVEACLNGQVIKLLPLKIIREDVLSSYPTLKYAKSCGFSANIGTFGFPENFELSLRAVIKGGSGEERIKIPFASIHAKRNFVKPVDYIPKRQPLMLTSMPRSGTTWVMKMLSNMPRVIAHSAYPYEMRVASYWMHTLKILSDPADFFRSTIPDNFESNMEIIGHNPYYDPHYFSGRSNMERLHSNNVFDNTATCCIKNIDSFYDAVEEDEGKGGTQYFLEKQMPSHIQNIYRELYSGGKEIVLIRDLRDVICSAMHFNNKRNTKEFGRGLVETDREWIENMRANLFERILVTVRKKNNDILLIRYEDIIRNPHEALFKVYDYLGYQATQHEIEKVLKISGIANQEMDEHQTSRDSNDSINRWKNDLDEETKGICNELLGDALLELGYDV